MGIKADIEVTGYIFLDVESTGLESSSDVIQFAYIETDNNLKIQSYGNVFMNTDKYLTDTVKNITGLNRLKLETLSKNKYFEDVMDDIMPMLRNRSKVVVGHNVSFDIRMLNSNLERHGRLPTEHASTECTMNDYRPKMMMKGSNGRIKNPKLEQAFNWALEQRGINKASIQETYTKIFGREPQAHDALYDVYMSYILKRLS